MSDGKERKNDFVTRLVGDQDTSTKYPVLNHVMMIYIGAVLVCYTLYLIAPFLTFIAQTPFYSMQTYLGIVGAVLLCIDLFTNKVLWRAKYSVLLYGICIISVIASVRTISYGIKDNLFIICWTTVQFAIFYSCAHRFDSAKFKKYIKWIYAVLLVIWFIACCISLCQYVFQIGYEYVIDPISEDASVSRQGFMENRLFGIFNPLNHAAYVSLMLMITGVYFIIDSKRKSRKVMLVMANLPLLLHIILSGSRSTMVSLVVCVFVIVWLESWGKVQQVGWKKLLLPSVTAIAVAVLFSAGCDVVKDQLAKVPGFVQYAIVNASSENAFVEPSDDPENEEMEELSDDLENEETDDSENSQALLDRKGLDGDISNDRFKIWKDYLSIYDDIGLWGLSPGNYMPYIKDNHHTLYIVRYTQYNFPEKFDAGTIYHVHNGYLMTFVSTGILGALLMVAFILLCIVRVILHIKRSCAPSHAFIFSLAIVIAGALSAVFDKGVFFMNNPSSFMFWLALSIVMKNACHENEKISLKKGEAL